MSHRKFHIILALLIIGLVSSHCRAATDDDPVLQTLRSGSSQEKQSAADELVSGAEHDPDMTGHKIAGIWIPALRDAKLYAQAVSLAEIGIKNFKASDPPTDAEISDLVNLWGYRVMCVAAEGKAKEAVDVLKEASGKKLGNKCLGYCYAIYQEVPDVLMQSDHCDEAAQVAQMGIFINADNTSMVVNLQEKKVEAYRKEKKFDAALEAAKGFYNIAPLASTTQAIDLVAGCLVMARPKDHGIAGLFKRQQVAGANSTSSTQPANVPDNVLKSITIKSSEYDDAIKGFDDASYVSLIAQGNLQLLADRGVEARECFETARDLADTESQITAATEGIIKAIRAQDGSVGRANAYLLEQQQSNGQNN